jgi:hypothetical protein
MNTNETKLTVISNKTFEATKNISLNYHDISSALQTTLEFNKLISTFSNHIMGMVPHSAYSYVNLEMAQGIKKGVFTKHSCSYALQFEVQQLGELTLMRNEMFGNAELELLETLLCCLIYPLKNATLYHKALKMAKVEPFDALIEVNNRDSDTFGKVFSSGINAHIEHNRRLSDKKNFTNTPKEQVDDRCPWAVGFLR